MIGQIKTSGYAGIENTNYYEYLRVGTIIKIDYNSPQKGGASRRITYGTAQIQWADVRLGTIDQIALSFPMAGQGWGIFSYPRAGDVIVAGFRPGGFAVVLGYLMGNPYYERGAVQADGTRMPPSSTEGAEVLYRPNRYLTGGEQMFKSYQGAEIYMDRFANMRFIVRESRDDTEVNNANDLTLDMVKETNKIFELWMGTVRTDDLYLLAVDEETKTITRTDNKKLSFNGKDVNLDLTHASGMNLQIDKEGSIGLTSPKDVVTNTAGEEIHMATKGYTIVVNGANGTITVTLGEDGDINITDGAGSVIACDGAGKINVTSPNGTSLDIEDDNVQVTTSGGTGIVVDETSQQVSINAQNVVVNGGVISLGQSATHPVTVSDLMATAFNALVTAFNTHTHIYSAGPVAGAITPPPVIPALPVTPVQISSTVALAL